MKIFKKHFGGLSDDSVSKSTGLDIVSMGFIFFVGPDHVVFEIKNFHRANF